MSRYARRIVVLTTFLVGFVVAEDMMLSVNVKKPVAIVSDKFLSVTLDPAVLFNTDLSGDGEKSISMAKALSPAYIRLGGPRSNSYVFERSLHPQELHNDPGYSFTDAHWVHVHQWAEKSGLDVIACIAPQQPDSGRTSWDPRNALDLISFSDQMGYNTSWQLGYECQTRCDVSGADLARDVQRLRGMLDAFPRYAENSIIAGPDVVTYKTRQQQQYLQEYFNAASASLDAVTWHPDFAGISLEAEGVSMHHDNLAMEKDSFYRIVGRHISKKPLWIAESRPEECKQQFLGALVWARRLGNSAKLGIQVLMRQPENSNLFKPTPDYWVSVLHKMLVGREVLDTKIASGNRTHVHFYAQCTKPSSRYERGSVTVFGINLTPSKITASLKGLKLKVVHKYILLPGFDAPNRMFAETVLLNNEPLNLVNDKEVPDVQPLVASGEKGVKLKLPSGGIGFWVLPGLKVKSCLLNDDDAIDKNLLKKLNKHLEEFEADEEMEYESEQEGTESVDSDESKKTNVRQQQQLSQRRIPSRRSVRHREEEKDEQDDRRIRRFDGNRHELERLEKNHVRKKDHHLFSLKSVRNRGIFERKDDDDNSEEGILNYAENGQGLDSGEMIRAKLEQYQKRLADYENRKKQRELIENLTKDRLKNDPADSQKNLDTGKVIETLTLLTKVESAMKGLEKETENESQVTNTPKTLNLNDFTGITPGVPQNNPTDQGDDKLLDDVLNTEKSKKTSVPSKIEDQIKALYRLLSEEKEKREGQTMRQRRDLDTRFGDDPLGLRQDSIFLRKKTKTEEAKERRLERINERKQRLKEKLDQKREKDEMKKESLENNFYGFQQKEPLKGFPEGDVYLQTGVDSKENKDYVNANQEVKQLKYQVKPGTIASKVGDDENEDLWLEDGEASHMPNEFYENVKLQEFKAKDNLKPFGELWEAEAIPKNNENDKRIEEPLVHVNHEIVTERQLPESEDRKAKEKAVQQLRNYYAINPYERTQVYDFEDLRKQQQQQQQPQQLQPQQPQQQQQVYYQQQVLPTYQQNPVPTNDAYHAQHVQNPYANTGGYYIDPNHYMQTNQNNYYRAKRYINDLEDIFRREMITQDDNNLKDCRCRVIRGVTKCENCDMQFVDYGRSSLANIPNDIIINLRNRFRRDIEIAEAEMDKRKADEVKEIEPIVSTTTTITPITTTSPETEAPIEEQGVELKDAVNLEIVLEDTNEPKENSTLVHIKDDKINVEDNSDKTSASRLPRKIQNSKKIFLITKGSTTTPPSKKNQQVNKKESSSTTENYKSTTQSSIDNNKETAKEHVANTQTAKPDSTNTSAKTYQEVDKQPFLVKINPVANKNEKVDPVTDKPLISNLAIKREIPDEQNSSHTVKVDNIKIESPPVTQSTTAPTASDKVLSKMLPVKAKPASTMNIEMKSKPKSNNTMKVEEMVKSRQARLTTRAEALAALRKENESKRANKMIENSMKILENENNKFMEYQRRRREQLEKLKEKLRAKREKMLQQYRDELLEAINESTDGKESRLRRRDLLQKDDDNSESQMKYDQDYVPKSRLPKYSSQQDDYKPSIMEKYATLMDVIQPFESNNHHVASRNPDKIHMDDNDETDIINEENTAIPIDFRNDETCDLSDEQDFRVTNQKRSPYSLIDRYAMNKENNRQKPNDSEDENQKEDERKQRYQHLAEYYPQSKYREGGIPIQMDYNQYPLYAQPRHPKLNYYSRNPIYDQYPYHELSYYDDHQGDENNYLLGGINYYPDIEEPQDPHLFQYEQQRQQYQQQQHDYQLQKLKYQQRHQKQQQKYYLQQQKYLQLQQQYQQQQAQQQYYQQQQQQQQPQHVPENLYNANPLVNDEAQQPEQSNKKSKRASMKNVEIDSSLYVEAEPEYNLQELLMKPSHVYSRRYRRKASSNDKEGIGKTLQLTYGLEKQGIDQKELENSDGAEAVIRAKRVADDFLPSEPEKPLETSLPTTKKNVKKVRRKNNYNNPKKRPRTLKPARQSKRFASVNGEIAKISEKIKKQSPKPKIPKIEKQHNESKNKKIPSKREKRSFDDNYNYHAIEDNRINRLNDPEMDEIWNNIIEMKQDEELLREYNRQKGEIINNFRDTQRHIKKFLKSTTKNPIDDNYLSMTTSKPTESTTYANIESMLVDAIPKLESVITGGLEKAQNITGSLEDFIENFDDQFRDTTQYPRNNTESAETDQPSEERLSHNVFRTMVGSVKKFFGLVSNIAKIFHGH